jgi:hypothetical protein
MSSEHFCIYHPTREALSFCHHCHDWICSQCASEGQQYYYCRKPECQKALKIEGAFVHVESASKIKSNDFHSFDPTVQLKNEDLVTIASYQNDFLANLVKTKLESEGIETYLIGDTPESLTRCPFVGIRVQTKKSDALRAGKIIREVQN